jgi:hypothetical protein
MAQDLTVNIKTTSDVPEAMGKAKSATVSFSKQVEDIQKKFSTAFKDIFLGFTAPMILLQGAISYITGAIEKAKQDARDGLDLLARGESKFATSEEQKAASFFKRRAELKEEQRLAEEGRAEITKQVLTSPEFKDFVLPDQFKRRLAAGEAISSISRDKGLQQDALDFYKNTAEGRKITEGMDLGKQPGTQPKGADFKGPEGFGNVIGVGANPVMEAMNAQLEEQRKQTGLLQNLVDRNPFGSTDFTKSSSPSRAAMLMGN